jgi:phospholipid-translocating ATPase
MAKLGLRTLLLGKKELSPENATEWLARHAAASVSVGERDDALASVAADIENDLVLIAATGIEDKLQDEVPETIADLAVAGIKVFIYLIG